MGPHLKGRNLLALEILTSSDLNEALRVIFAVQFAMGLLVAISYFILSRTRFSNDPRKGIVRTVRGLQIWLVLLMILLVSGLIKMRGEPLFPYLIGMFVNICWQAGTVFALRVQKKKLRDLDDADSITKIGRDVENAKVSTT